MVGRKEQMLADHLVDEKVGKMVDMKEGMMVVMRVDYLVVY